MPTSYAHYKFGQRVVDELPEKYQYFAYTYPEYFYPALHGPDVTFYLVPDSKVVELGNELHRWSGKKYFERVGKLILEEVGNADPVDKDAVYGKWTNRKTEQKLAYLYGFLCHYALDRTGHKYVNAMVEQGVASHYAIEAEFDRFLLARDGYDPLHHSVTDHIHPSMEIAENMKPFFPGVSANEMFGAMFLQKWLLRYFNLPTKYPRMAFRALTKKLGMEDFGDLYMPSEAPEWAVETNRELDRILKETIPECVEFIVDLLDMVTGKKPWDERFQWNFDGEFVGW